MIICETSVKITDPKILKNRNFIFTLSPLFTFSFYIVPLLDLPNVPDNSNILHFELRFRKQACSTENVRF